MNLIRLSLVGPLVFLLCANHACADSQPAEAQHTINACTKLDMASDPRVLATAMLAGMDPKAYLSFMKELPDPETVRRYLVSRTSQATLDKAYSSTQPEFQNALLARVTPQKENAGWQHSMRDLDYIQSAIYVLAGPMQWMNVTAQGQVTGAMLNWFDPDRNAGWIRLTPSQPDQPNNSLGQPGSRPAPELSELAAPLQRY
jgi:hypothetical protein